MLRVLHPRLRFIEPQLASLVDKPPEGKHWIYEIKHDGYRSQVVIERGQVRVFSRNGHDWSDRYPSIVRAAAELACQSAIIDGEAIVQDDNGASNFEANTHAPYHFVPRGHHRLCYPYFFCRRLVIFPKRPKWPIRGLPVRRGKSLVARHADRLLGLVCAGKERQ